MYPKYEKVDDNTIRIITERADEVTLAKLIETRQQIEEKLKQLTETLKNINDILDNANQLGIIPEEKKKDVEK